MSDSCITSQHALLAVLAFAFDVGNLPFQRPLLHILDNVYDLKTALCEGVLALHGKEGAVHSVLHQPFLFQLPQARREHLLGDAEKAVLQLGKAPGVPFTLVKLQENEQRPFSGDVLDCQVHRASFLHGIFAETL